MKKMTALLSALLTVCIVVGGFAIYKICKEKAEVAEAERLADEMADYSPSGGFADGAEYARIYADFAPSLLEMQAVNPDIVGWIYIPGTRIDYPLLQGSDNSYYLKHNPSGKYSIAGSVFIDKRGSDCDNIVIYGHNMSEASGVIFHDLTRFAEREFFDIVTVGYIITSAGVTRLDIFAYALTKPQSGFYYDTADYDFIKSNAIYYREPTKGQLYTLSTCAYDFTDARAVITAVGTAVYAAE